MHTYGETYIAAYRTTVQRKGGHRCVHIYIYIYICAHVHTYHTYIHTYIHTKHTHTCISTVLALATVQVRRPTNVRMSRPACVCGEYCYYICSCAHEHTMLHNSYWMTTECHAGSTSTESSRQGTVVGLTTIQIPKNV